jgi:hypothetical protein
VIVVPASRATLTKAVTRRFDAVSPPEAPGAAQLGRRQVRKSTGSRPSISAGAGANALTAPASGRP